MVQSENLEGRYVEKKRKKKDLGVQKDEVDLMLIEIWKSDQ